MLKLVPTPPLQMPKLVFVMLGVLFPLLQVAEEE
jgi:hypothetical protein